MSAKTNLAAARVTHLLDSAQLSRAHGLEGAADRFLTLARENLDSMKGPQADALKARLAQLQGVNA